MQIDTITRNMGTWITSCAATRGDHGIQVAVSATPEKDRKPRNITR